MLRHQLILLAVSVVVMMQLHHVASKATGCQGNFNQVGDKCLLTTLNLLNWNEADRQCQSLGGGLLSLQNESQLKQVQQWLRNTEPWIFEFWTSGNSLGHKGSYNWQGTSDAVPYLPWSPDQPQSADGDCLTLHANDHNMSGFSDYRLTVKSCSATAPIICEQQ